MIIYMQIDTKRVENIKQVFGQIFGVQDPTVD